MPHVSNKTIETVAAVYAWESAKRNARTTAVLRAAKDRGVKLGVTGTANLKLGIEKRKRAADEFATSLLQVIRGFGLTCVSQRQVVKQLNDVGIKTARGGTWSLNQLQRVIRRVDPTNRSLTELHD